MDPVHGPPLQARVAAANGTVLAAGKLLALSETNKPPALADGDPGAHGMNRWQANRSKMDGTGAKQNERGKNLRWAVGMAGKDGRQTKARRTSTAGNTASGFSARHMRVRLSVRYPPAQTAQPIVLKISEI